MNRHNQIIEQALNDYLHIDNPGYAVLLKGDWGSGKSFFIKRWKGAVEEGLPEVNGEEDEDIINLKPIYVSLNGLKTVSQIDEAIKKVISPFLHSKFVKNLGKVAKIAASIAVRYNVDLNNDNKPEQMVCTIDPKMLLEWNPAKVRGKRLLIFDDIERAEMPITEVLGYVNYFVEQLGCYIIIVGDVRNIGDQTKYKQIKEKTIGHEYKLEAEIEEALTAFIKEIDSSGFLQLNDLRNLITYCFRVSEVKNLRILRQSLYDYKMYVSHLPEEVLKAEEFTSIKTYLLANFLVVYAEYKSGKAVMEDYSKLLNSESFSRMLGNKEDNPGHPASDIHAKYDKVGLTESHRVLNSGYVDIIMNYLLQGEVDATFLTGEVKRDRSTPWEKLSQYMALSNDEFIKNLNHTAGYLENGDFEVIDYLLLATCSMLVVIKRGMTHNYTEDKVIEWCLNAIENKFFPQCQIMDELYGMKIHAHQCLGYYQSESIVEEVNRLGKGIEDVFHKIAPTKKNAMTKMLETLNDKSIDSLIGTYVKAIPDHSVTYSMHAIFSQVDPQKFVDSYVKLNNDSKSKFIQFVKHHYGQAFRASNAEDFVHYYEDDLNTLPEIVKLLKEAAQQESLVDKQNIELLSQVLTENGDTIQVLSLEKNKKTSPTA